jgi:hypothetical protein
MHMGTTAREWILCRFFITVTAVPDASSLRINLLTLHPKGLGANLGLLLLRLQYLCCSAVSRDQCFLFVSFSSCLSLR